MPSASTAARGRTVFQKIWEDHVVRELSDDFDIIYIDRHLIYEGASSYAFESLRMSQRPLFRCGATLGTVDHMVPTVDRSHGVEYEPARVLIDVFDKNCEAFAIPKFSLHDRRQGIVHIIGPEQGFTLPGTTIACGDSHTATHGALGALAFGVGSSEVEHVLATQTLVVQRPKQMLVRLNGRCGPGVTPKDVILFVIGRLGTAAGREFAIEYSGEFIAVTSVEGRMTICNMSTELGAVTGIVAPDRKTSDYLLGRALAPTGEDWDRAQSYWSSLRSDETATFDAVHEFNVGEVLPQVTWGTNPEQVVEVTGRVPDPARLTTAALRDSYSRALNYMGLAPGTPMQDIAVDVVFIGSCTNARIEDLRAAARIVSGRRVAANVKAMVVPGSGLVRLQAEREGLDMIFREAGFEWRSPGCSMCLGINGEVLRPGQRCASTSNRNYEGRQGEGGRTHLMSPAMAAAAAVAGRIVDVRTLGGAA